MNAVQPIVWPVDDATSTADTLGEGERNHDPRWQLKVLGVRLATASMRVSSEFNGVLVGHEGAVDRWNAALDSQEQLRAEFRAMLETASGMSLDLIERTLAL